MGYIDFLLFFCALSFIFWGNIFALPRYYLPLTGLTGIIALGLILKIIYVLDFSFFSLLKKGKLKQFLFTKFHFEVLILFITWLVSQCFFDLYNIRLSHFRIPIHSKALYIQDMKIPDDSIVLTGVGVGIIIPFQNPKAAYIKNTNIYSPKIQKKITNKIKEKSDKIFLLSEENLEVYKNMDAPQIKSFLENIKVKNTTDLRKKKKLSKAIDSLKRLSQFGLDIKSIQCQKIKVDFEKKENEFFLCTVEVKR